MEACGAFDPGSSPGRVVINRVSGELPPKGKCVPLGSVRVPAGSFASFKALVHLDIFLNMLNIIYNIYCDVMSVFINDKKGQGALEYLLILGGLVLGAAIVLVVLIKSSNRGISDTNKTFEDFDTIRDGVRDTN